MTPRFVVFIEEGEKKYPIQVSISDPFVFRFAFTLEEAESFATQILNVCQDYRKEKENVDH